MQCEQLLPESGKDETEDKGEEETEVEVQKQQEPMFLSMPDGTISEGWPPGYKDISPPPSPRATDLGVDVMLQAEYESIYMRHSRLFLIILVIELIIDALFTCLYITFRRMSMDEVTRVYDTFQPRELEYLFWSVLYIDWTYCLVYYGVGFGAFINCSTTLYRFFSLVAGFGIFSQVILAYMNTFNLVVFFLRMTGYIYGKFLGNLRRSIDLIPEAVLGV